MKRILGTGLIIAISFLAGCGTNETIGANERATMTNKANGYDEYAIEVIIDKETGVEYLYVFEERHSYGAGSAITPRYNADGSLRVSK